MKYNIPEAVQHVIDQLKAVGIEATLVGGALRAAALGGTTNDYDLVIFGEREDFFSIDTEIERLGFRNQHHDEYCNNEGYVADWRKDDINIIMYDSCKVADWYDLIEVFDLNINQWYINEAGELENDYYDSETKLVTINPFRDGLGHAERLTQRIERFRSILPDLDWSEIEKRRRVNDYLGTEIVSYV